MDLTQIIGKTPSEIESILGHSESTERDELGATNNTYKKGKFKIVYYDDIPATITIYNIDKLPLTGQLGMLGLPNAAGYRQTEIVKVWEEIINDADSKVI